MFAASGDAAALKPVQKSSREHGDFRWVYAESPGAQPVVLVVARKVKHGRKVQIESHQAKGARRKLTEFLCEVRTSGFAHGLGRRHRLHNVAEAVNEPTFLVNCDDDIMINGVAYLRVEQCDLLRRFYV